MKFEEIIKIFKQIVGELNKDSVYPIIYGSLGLHLKLPDDNSIINDIDFIIENQKEFTICKDKMMKLGFEIDPDHNREFTRSNFFVSFINKKDVENLIGEPLKFELVTLDNAKFCNLNLKQYYQIYTKGLKNIYRKGKKEKDDLDKIKLIAIYIDN